MQNIDFGEAHIFDAVKDLLVLVIDKTHVFIGVFNENKVLVYSKTIPLYLLEKDRDFGKLASLRTIIVSKQLPVLHTGMENDELNNFFPAFLPLVKYKEKFVGQEVYTYFGLTKEQYEVLERNFPTTTIHHISSIYASYWKVLDQNIFHLDINKSSICIYHQTKDGFQFYNQFDYKSENDILYFCLLVYKQLGLNPEIDAMHLSGQITKKSLIYNKLFNFFKELAFIDDASFGHFDQIEQHVYFDLLASSTCES